MKEAGVRDFEAVAWLALFAPKGVPAAIIERVDTAIRDGLRLAKVVDRAGKAGLDPDYRTSAELTRRISEESALWAEVIKSADIRI
jgi:tripartite-type tricarboxylate transporter receptor subunit TctC